MIQSQGVPVQCTKSPLLCCGKDFHTGNGGSETASSVDQNPQTFEITYGQKEYAEHLRPINLPKDRLKNKESLATDKEVAALRAINGAANWLSSQSRPDLATQTSFSQQCSKFET